MPRKRRLRLNWPLIVASLASILAMGSLILWLTITRSTSGNIFSTQWQLALVSSCMEAVAALWFASIGASIGSFLNVAAWRVPNGISLLIPSRCPYCNTKLSAQDNFPIFGWLRLRGRCRTCRLPISMRYLLVELLLLFVFVWTFFNEFLTLGTNLPSEPFKQFMSLENRLLETNFGLLAFLYLWVESGLIVVALMTLQKNIASWRVFLWTALPCVVLPLVLPSVIQVPWRDTVIESNNHALIEALITVVCGMGLGLVVGKILAFVTNDKPEVALTGEQPVERGSNHRNITGCFIVAGGLLGWQAVVVVGVTSLILAWIAQYLLFSRLIPNSLQRWRDNASAISSLSVWIWLAVLVYRSTWNFWIQVPSWFSMS